MHEPLLGRPVPARVGAHDSPGGCFGDDRRHACERRLAEVERAAAREAHYWALLAEAGVDVYVAGSALFGKPDPVEEVRQLKHLIDNV